MNDQNSKSNNVNGNIYVDDEDYKKYENLIRPKMLNDFIGQTKLKQALEIYIVSHKNRNDILGHMLFTGPAGLGKTTLAKIVANEMGVNIITVSGPTLRKTKDIIKVLKSIRSGDVLFIDEIHRTPPIIQEILYLVMEDFTFPYIKGEHVVNLETPKFTLIGSTTKISLLAKPFLDRLGFEHTIDYYDVDSINQIVIRTAGILGIKLQDDATYSIADRSRGTPRVANKYLKIVRNHVNFEEHGDESGLISNEVVDNALAIYGVDQKGLVGVDRKILHIIADRFSGGPVGLKTLAAAVGEDPKAVEEFHEPFLIAKGFIDRTPQGRVLTPFAIKELDLKIIGTMKGTYKGKSKGPVAKEDLFKWKDKNER